MTGLIEPDEMVRLVCSAMGVPYQRLMDKSRRPDVVDARSVAAFVLRTRYGFSYPQLAPFLGCKDHTSAMYHFGRTEQTPSLAEKARTFLVEVAA